MNLDVQQFKKIRDMHYEHLNVHLYENQWGTVIESMSTKLIGWLGQNLGFDGW
jgi:hypothetical protein